MKIIIAQIIGIFIVISNIILDVETNEKRILTKNAIVNLLCCMQYFILGGYSGAVCCIIAVLRNIVFYIKNDKIPVTYLLIYYVLLTFMTYLTYSGLLSLIPAINIAIYTFFLWKGNVKLFKISNIYTGTTGVIYDISLKAYSGMIMNLTDAISGIILTIKLSKKNKDLLKK